MEEIKDRITIRLNDVEKAQLKLFMEQNDISNPSEALKAGVNWVNTHIKNVSNLFFPSTHDVILRKKLKTYKPKKKVYD